MWTCIHHSAGALRLIFASAARCLLQGLGRLRPDEFTSRLARGSAGTAGGPGAPAAAAAANLPRVSARLAGASLVLTGISGAAGAKADGDEGGGGAVCVDLREVPLPRSTLRQVTEADAAAHVRQVYMPPRYPVVLCHGLFGYDTLGPQSVPWLQRHYWSGIKEALETLGATVLTTSVPATGDVVQRAEALDAQLRRHMAGQDVNLVAHSMGGLDCRYLTYVKARREQGEGGRHLDEAYRIRSLTTLATPHRGSPFMDWCRDNMGVGWTKVLGKDFPGLAGVDDKAKGGGHESVKDVDVESSRKAAGSATVISRLLSTFDYPAYACLTTEFCEKVFNRAIPDVPGVSYYSYGAAAEIPVYDTLRIPWEIVRRKEGPNDGIVSVQSARWGRYWETLEADHFELTKRCHSRVVRDPLTGRVTVRPKKRKPPEASRGSAFDTVEFVCRMSTRLHREGF